jgi:hypothetical protein
MQNMCEGQTVPQEMMAKSYSGLRMRCRRCCVARIALLEWVYCDVAISEIAEK